MAERKIRGFDMIDLVKAVKKWREANPDKEVPGLLDEDNAFLCGERIMPTAWYPLEQWFRWLKAVHQIVYGGTQDGAEQMGYVASMYIHSGPLTGVIKHKDIPRTVDALDRNLNRHHTFGEWTWERTSETTCEILIRDYLDMPFVHGHLLSGWFRAIVGLCELSLTKAEVTAAPWDGDAEYRLCLEWDEA